MRQTVYCPLDTTCVCVCVRACVCVAIRTPACPPPPKSRIPDKNIFLGRSDPRVPHWLEVSSSTHLSVFPAQGFICRRSHFLWQPLPPLPPTLPPPPHTVRSLTATQWAALRRGAAGRAARMGFFPLDESGEMLPPVGRVKRRQQLIIEFSVGRDLKKMFWVKVGFFFISEIRLSQVNVFSSSLE